MFPKIQQSQSLTATFAAFIATPTTSATFFIHKKYTAQHEKFLP